MSGRLTRIEKTINSQLDSLHIKVVPRGIPYFIDGLLRGTTRFAKRTGNNNAVINPDNTFKIDREVTVGEKSVFIERKNDWITMDSLIRVGPNKEIVEVEDISNNRIIFKENLKFSYTTNDEILLYATPLILDTDRVAGDKVITVRSKFKIANGDTFGYLPTSGILQSFTDSEIVKSTYAGINSDPNYPFLYSLELKTGLNKELAQETIVYIRSNPAYFSNRIRVPNLVNSTDSMGPFLIDYLSGRILEGFSPKETFALKLIDRSGNYNRGSEFDYETSNKNHVVVNRPIDSKSFVFFSTANGDTKISPNRLVMELKDYKYRITEKLVPSLDFNGQMYRFTTTSNTTGKMYIHLNSDFRIDIDIEPGNQTHTIEMPIGEKYQMDITMLCETPTGRITMTSWTQVGPQVEFIEYSLVVNATGRGGYQSTGVSLKPYFLTPAILSGRYDSGDNHDSGFVYF